MEGLGKETGRRPRQRRPEPESRKTGRGRLCLALVLALSVCLLTGCRLALDEAKIQDSENDRLVGVFVTEQYLDSGMPEVTVNSRGEISVAENREGMDGTLIFDETRLEDIAFDGIEGYGIYDIRVWEDALGIYTSYAIADDIFSDGFWKMSGEESAEAEVTIYVGQDGSDSFYFNPVYQTAQGDVYMQPGTGLFCTEKAEGSSSTHTLSWERKTAGNGQETVESSSFTIHIVYVGLIPSYKLLFMDGDSSVADVMTGDELVNMWEAEQWELKVPAGTAYLILEQEKENGDIARVICSRGEESLEFLRSVDGGYMVKQQMYIIW